MNRSPEPPRQHPTRRPYDAAAEDLTDEFWGPLRLESRPVRRHDVPVASTSPRRPEPPVVRAGLFVLAALLAVPLVAATRPDRGSPIAAVAVVDAAAPAASVPGVAPTAQSAPIVPSDATSAEGSSSGTDGDLATEDRSAGSPASGSVDDPPDITTTGDTSSDDSPARPADPVTAASQQVPMSVPPPALDVGADVAAPARRVVPDCPQTYTAGAGDSWYRIAEEAGISVGDLLDENNATLLAVIHPGDTICLPADATIPSPPPTTTAPPSPTSTTAPTTTAPTTTTMPPTSNLSPAEVQDLIRRTWPADQVDKALAVAWRESNYIATADNGWCCVGVFQIYWTVHRSWLGQFGVHERDDLKDARKNIAAAYHLWQSQGWGPWGG
jgi:LysM repeat protein